MWGHLYESRFESHYILSLSIWKKLEYIPWLGIMMWGRICLISFIDVILTCHFGGIENTQNRLSRPHNFLPMYILVDYTCGKFERWRVNIDKYRAVAWGFRLGGARFSPTIQNFRQAAIFPRNFTKFGKFFKLNGRSL